MDIQTQTLSTRRRGHVFSLGPAGSEEIWLVLHGYGQLADRFLRHFTALAGAQRRVVAPEGLSRFYLDDAYERVGASWMTRLRREDEVVDCHAWLDQVYAAQCEASATPPRLTVLGFSQGAPTAGRWLMQCRPEGVERLICWGAGLPHDVDLRKLAPYLSGLRIQFVLGDQDEFLTADRVARERERVRLAGIPAEWIEYEGTHRIDREVLAGLADA
jgi:predicted esterase